MSQDPQGLLSGPGDLPRFVQGVSRHLDVAAVVVRIEGVETQFLPLFQGFQEDFLDTGAEGDFLPLIHARPLVHAADGDQFLQGLYLLFPVVPDGFLYLVQVVCHGCSSV